jgi:hypothetical protein
MPCAHGSISDHGSVELIMEVEEQAYLPEELD